MSLLVKGAFEVMTGLGRAGAADIRIRDGKILQIEKQLTREKDETVVDASGCVVYPAWVNTHHHLFQALMKGIPAGLNAPLRDWLFGVPMSYRGGLDEELLRVSARLGIVELMLSGCATVFDHHYHNYPGIPYDGPAILFEEAERLGVRFVLGRGGTTLAAPEFGGAAPWLAPETADAMIADVERLAARYQDPSPLAFRRVVMAPTSPHFRVRPEELPEFARAARRLGLRMHTHLSENLDYLTHVRAQHGVSPVEFCAERGWIGSDVWFAHLCHVSDEEIALMAGEGTGIAHCPGSNCRLGSGIARAPEMDAAGMPVSLGVDGAAANEPGDMLSEAHLAWYLHRAAKGAAGAPDGGADAVSIEDVIRWGTAGGARVLGLHTGVLAPGYAADLAIYQPDELRHLGIHDAALAPVASGVRPKLRRLICGGRTIVEDDRIPGLDLDQLAAQVRSAVGRMKLFTPPSYHLAH